MKNEHLVEIHDGGVAVLTMNRPASLNAFSGPMMDGLAEAIPRLADDSSVRVLVLTGSGRAFSAGGDVKGFASSSSSGSSATSSAAHSSPSTEQRIAGLRKSTELVELLHTIRKPTIAAIPGVVAGGGLGVALACDLRLAKASARFTTAFAKIALSGDYGGSYFLTKLVGPAKAKELYFSSAIIDAEEARQLGIVNHVFDNDDYEERVREFTQDIASMSPIALGYMKENINRAENATLSDVLDQEAVHMTRCFDTEDHRMGARAFVTKETPSFAGR